MFNRRLSFVFRLLKYRSKSCFCILHQTWGFLLSKESEGPFKSPVIKGAPCAWGPNNLGHFDVTVCPLAECAFANGRVSATIRFSVRLCCPLSPLCNKKAVTASSAKAKSPTAHRRRGRKGKSVYRGVCVTREGKWRAVIYKERKQVR